MTILKGTILKEIWFTDVIVIPNSSLHLKCHPVDHRQNRLCFSHFQTQTSATPNFPQTELTGERGIHCHTRGMPEGKVRPLRSVGRGEEDYVMQSELSMEPSGKVCETFCPLRRGRFPPQLSTKNTCPQTLCEYHKTPFVLAGPLTSLHSISLHRLFYLWGLTPAEVGWYAASTFQHVMTNQAISVQRENSINS